MDPTAITATTSLAEPLIVPTTTPKPVIFRQDRTSQELYIALPIILGFLLLMLVGTWYYNRQQHKINIVGSVMGRQGYGYGKSQSERLELGKWNSRKNKKSLQERELLMGVSGSKYD